MSTAPLSSFEKDIPAVDALLATDADLSAFFADLTPGYQREWARFIFGAKAPATKQRHIEVMKTVFQAGYKSKRAYDSRPNK
ncbi:hypothetical protein N644_1300 [Lactiplantibacillus paraplantarum]|uniref:YdeI/OmpD-associated family protein n=1 Tax=Lactiplantibacillus paraplantarum TaxID=60520 RepID=UPI0003AE6FF4|nr:YdeI/OmpD-associated family protein [Lactiplantibacillus paraplantarum]ERL44602.1 hypothetical protein N644_1300 [Lactiplantibacillus paraplantarum]